MAGSRAEASGRWAELVLVAALAAFLLGAAVTRVGHAPAPPDALFDVKAAPRPLPNVEEPPAIETPPKAEGAAVEPRADASFDRSGRTAFAGGYLVVTPDFASADGTYDVVFHFHGNTELVEQSLAAAHIGAVFVPQNLGIGSGPYENRFTDPTAVPEMLARVQAAMEKRGLAHARLGRVALIAWSAGYGAVLRILEHPEIAERLDAVVLLDALHIGRVPHRRAPAVEQLVPYERFARWAIEGRKLFTITHSEITPGRYVGVRESTDLLLARLGVLRYAAGEEPLVPDFPAALTVLPKQLRVPLPPMTLAERGALHVRGYGGNGPDTHMLHLLEMSSTALPDLAAWWSRPRDASP